MNPGIVLGVVLITLGSVASYGNGLEPETNSGSPPAAEEKAPSAEEIAPPAFEGTSEIGMGSTPVEWCKKNPLYPTCEDLCKTSPETKVCKIIRLCASDPSNPQCNADEPQ